MDIVEAIENHNICSYSICRNTLLSSHSSKKKCVYNLSLSKTILRLFFYCGNRIVLDLNRLVWMNTLRNRCLWLAPDHVNPGPAEEASRARVSPAKSHLGYWRLAVHPAGVVQSGWRKTFSSSDEMALVGKAVEPDRMLGLNLASL